MSRTRVEILNIPVPDSRLSLNVQDLRPTHVSKILTSPGATDGFSTRRFSALQSSYHHPGWIPRDTSPLHLGSSLALPLPERREVRRLNVLSCYIGTLFLKIGSDWRGF